MGQRKLCFSVWFASVSTSRASSISAPRSSAKHWPLALALHPVLLSPCHISPLQSGSSHASPVIHHGWPCWPSVNWTVHPLKVSKWREVSSSLSSPPLRCQESPHAHIHNESQAQTPRQTHRHWKVSFVSPVAPDELIVKQSMTGETLLR